MKVMEGDKVKFTLYDYCIENERSDLLRQWHPTRNGDLTPEGLTYGSHQKIWWRCEKGHEWEAVIASRAGRQRGCPYCAGKKAWQGENDLASQNPELTAQWHPTKNKNLTPAQVTVGSHTKVWWICDEGHEWQAIVKSRNSGAGCPVCKRRTVLLGENDLATTHPHICNDWHPSKNGKLTPKDLVAGTMRKVWWICEHGHEWQAAVSSRTSNGSGCPVCAGKVIIPGENDLASAFPDVAKEWHPTKNGAISPQAVTPYSNRSVWWQCELGHEFRAAVGSRTGGSRGCPYCTGRRVLPGFNDLATREPKVAEQWHPTLNGTLKPDMVTVGSKKKVWWECPNRHVWKARIASRASGQRSGCPVCAGKVREDRQERYDSVMAD